MHFICHIDRNLYKVVAPDIVTDEVVIMDERISHIKAHHPNDFERFSIFFAEALQQPDYIIEANKPKTAVILKEIEVDGVLAKLILRLHTATDPVNYKNSIITFMKIDQKDWNRLIRNKKVLYKREGTIYNINTKKTMT